MCRHQEFLLFFIAVSYIGLMVSRPIKQREITKLELALENLKTAENQCVRHLFEEPPMAYSSGTLEPLDGITFPVRNTTDPNFQVSVEAINNYLNYCLPELVRPVVPNPSEILNNTSAFVINFQALAKKLSWNTSDDLQECRTNTKELKDYPKKGIILRIFYFCRKWTEEFIEKNCNNHASHH